MGFIKATIEVLGPEDEPYIPDDEDEDESSEKTIISPKIRSKGHVIISEIFKAESLIPVNLNTRKLDAYVKIKYGGNEVEIDEVDGSSNPTFNKIVFVKAMLPNHSKFVYVELWNSNSLMPDDIIGTARIPFNSFKDSLNQQPIWINIYGPPLSADNKFSKIMAKNGYRIGSTYRGRVLIRFSSRDSQNPVSGVEDMDYLLPDISVPAPLSKNYTLRIDVCSGSELPAPKQGILHFSLGNYFFKSSLRSIEPKKLTKGVTANSSKIIWNENLPDRKVFLPMDPKQIPDLFIYFCDEDVESHRTVYYRLNASEILVTNNKSFEATSKTRLIKFKEDKSKKRLEADQFAGFVVVRIQLFSFKPSLRDFFNFVSTKNIKTYELTFFIYVGRDLPSGDEDGSCRPVLEFICGNQRESIIPKSYSNKMPQFDPQGNLIAHPDNVDNIYLKLYDILDSRKDVAKNRSSVKKNKPFSKDELESLEHFNFDSKHMNEKKHVTSMNPNFYQAVTMNIEINNDNLVPPSVIIILLKHQKYDKNGQKTESVLLGRYWMSLNTDKNVLLKDKMETDTISLNFVFQKPIWIPMIYDKKEKIDGKILMSYSLIELDEDEMALREQFRQAVFNSPELFSNIVHKGYIRNFGENFQESLPLMTKYHLWPDSNIENLNLYFLGFRNIGLKNNVKDMSCLVRIHGVIDKFETNLDNTKKGETNAPSTPKPAIKSEIKNNKNNTNSRSNIPGQQIKTNQLEEHIMNKLNKRELKGDASIAFEDHGEQGDLLEFVLEDDLNTIKINEVMNIQVQAPMVKELAPVMEVFLFKGIGENKKLLSIGNYPMDKALANYYGIEDNIDYRKRWNEFLKLGSSGIRGEEGDDNPDIKPKIPRVKAQNKMNYFGVNYIVQLPDPKAATQTTTETEQKPETAQQGGHIQGKNDMIVHNEDNFDKENEQAPMSTFEGMEVGIRVGGKTLEELQQEKNMNPIQEENIQEEKEEQEEQLLGIEKSINQQTRSSQVKNPKSKREIVKSKFKQFKEDQKKKENQELNAFEKKKVKKNTKLLEQIEKMKIMKKAELEDGGSDMFSIDEEMDEQINQEAEKKGFQIDETRSQDDKHIKDMFIEDIRIERQNFSFDSDERENFNNDNMKEEIEDLQITGDKIPKMDSEISTKILKYDDEFVKENPDAIKKRRKEERNKFLNKFKMRGGFRSIFKKLKKRDVEYVDFDTDDDEEDLDEVLPFLKGRMKFGDDLEDLLYPIHKIKNIENICLFRGTQRINQPSFFGKIFGSKQEEYHEQGEMKVAFYQDDRSVMNPERITTFMNKIMKTRKYSIRAYILRGIKLSGILKDDETVKTKIEVSLNGKPANLDVGTSGEEIGFYPEYYRAYEFNEIEMPGTATLEITIYEVSLVKTIKLGYCKIDVEDRLLNPRWNKWELKPVEYRSVKNDIHGVRGRLEMWLDIFAEGDKTPMVPIFPIERLTYELRVIVWKTTDCVIKSTWSGANDTFVRGGVMRGNNFLETDTHWRCRNDGSFNYRWKFDITLPVEDERNYGEDKFKLQIWDRDLIMPNDLIGETEVNLNMHKMLKKAYKRRQPVEMRMKIKGTGVDTNQLLFNVYHPEKIDDVSGDKITQGKALMSFEVLPKEDADKLDNGVGRLDPNFFPTLPEPVGRFHFDIFSPCSTIKQIIGPAMCYKICYCFWCLVCTAICLFFGYYIMTNYIGVKLASIF